MLYYLAFELDFLFILGCDVLDWAVPIQEGGRRKEDSRCTERTISPDGSCLWSKSANHVGVARRAFGGETNCRFWIRMNESTIFADGRLSQLVFNYLGTFCSALEDYEKGAGFKPEIK